MSMHKSLKIQKWAGTRTVRKRRERLEVIYNNMIKGGLSEDDAASQLIIYGLPKEKIFKLKKAKKEKKEEAKTEGVI